MMGGFRRKWEHTSMGIGILMEQEHITEISSINIKREFVTKVKIGNWKWRGRNAGGHGKRIAKYKNYPCDFNDYCSFYRWRSNSSD